MGKVILDDALRAKLDLAANITALCDDKGKPVAYVLSAEEYTNLAYAWAHAAAATPEAEAERQASLEAYERGDCLTSEQLFAEIDAFLRTRAAS